MIDRREEEAEKYVDAIRDDFSLEIDKQRVRVLAPVIASAHRKGWDKRGEVDAEEATKSFDEFWSTRKAAYPAWDQSKEDDKHLATWLNGVKAGTKIANETWNRIAELEAALRDAECTCSDLCPEVVDAYVCPRCKALNGGKDA